MYTKPMNKKLFFIVLIFVCFKFENTLCQSLDLYINEFMASNNSIDIPGHINNDDWIELKNTTSSPIDISGYYVTDNLSNPTKVRLPVTPGSIVVPANGYLVLICSDNPSLGARHIVLGLSASGESIGLYAANGTTLIDSIVFGAQRPDVSMGRHPVNLSEWKYFTNPTPGKTNSTTGMYQELIPAPLFSHSGGFYNSSFNLSLSSEVTEATIYYTLDGSTPDPLNLSGTTYSYKNQLSGSLLQEVIKSYMYTSPILIVDRTDSLNKVSRKSSSYINGSSNSYFPSSPIAKGTVVKAIAYKSGGLSEVLTNTYFVFSNPAKYTFPVVSVSMDERDLFDYNTGFYTPGVNGISSSSCAWGNYAMEWKKSGYFEYFDNKDRVIARPVNYRIHGGCTRYFPRKSLRVLGGGPLDYPIFKREPVRNHRNIILRNSGNNWDENLFKDALNHQVMDNLKMGKQESTPSVVFLNGEYWGVHNIRERIDEHYLNTIYGVNKDSIDLIQISAGWVQTDAGDDIKYNELMDFLLERDFSIVANYDSLKKLIDVDYFIDYQIAHTFLANQDWPHNNVRLWRKRTDNSNLQQGFNDGRWRWVFFDSDLNMDYTFDALNRNLGTNNRHVRLFENLIENNEFIQKFCSRFADLLNTNFLPSRTTSMLTQFINKYAPEMTEHRERWGVPSTATLSTSYANMNGFFNNRGNNQRDHIRNLFEWESNRNIVVSVSNAQLGYVKVNTIDILSSTPGVSANPYPWTGIYFEGVPVTLTAVPKKGSKFKHWLRNGSLLSPNTVTITVNLSSSNNNPTYTAIFEEDILSDNPFPIAKVLDKCGYKFESWPETSAASTYPANMAFAYFNPVVMGRVEPDHILSDTLAGFTTGAFNHSNRSRINGLGAAGVSFINTGGTSEHPGYPFGKLGGIVLALNTTGQDSLYVNWTGGTVLPNFRDYAIRLQYRRGDKLDFEDLLDNNGQPIEYVRNETAGHYTVFEDIKLPDELLNEPYIQLLWRYYFKGQVISGARPQLRVDDIKIYSKANYVKGNVQQGVTANFSQIESKATIIPEEITEYNASEYILLEPGFSTATNAGFKAEITVCD